MRLVELQECCQIINGSTPSRNTKEYWDGDISWFTPKDLSGLESKYIEDSPEFITLEGYNSCSTTMIPAGSLLFTSRAPIGHLAINRKKVCTNQGFKTLVPNEGVDVEYLYYVIKKNVPQLQDLGNGATFKELSKATISKFKIPLPPPEEQKKIAAILDAADDYRQKTKALIDKYDQLTQSLFLDMFGDPVTNPMGWKKMKVSELVNPLRPVTYGILMPKENVRPLGKPYIKVVDVKNGEILKDQICHTREEIENKYQRSRLEENDILISIRGHVGRVCIVPKAFSGANITQDTARLDTKAILTPEFTESCFNTIEFQRNTARYVKGAGVKGINLGDLKNLEVPVPPKKKQIHFSKQILSLKSQRKQVQESIVKAEDLFNSLLQKAFKGELTN